MKLKARVHTLELVNRDLTADKAAMGAKVDELHVVLEELLRKEKTKLLEVWKSVDCKVQN